MSRLVIVLSLLGVILCIPMKGYAEVRIRDTSDVHAYHLEFELPQESNKVQAKKNTIRIAKHFNDMLRKHKDIVYGIYAVNEHSIVLQMTSLNDGLMNNSHGVRSCNNTFHVLPHLNPSPKTCQHYKQKKCKSAIAKRLGLNIKLL